jgi:hypothetical protein
MEIIQIIIREEQPVQTRFPNEWFKILSTVFELKLEKGKLFLPKQNIHYLNIDPTGGYNEIVCGFLKQHKIEADIIWRT